MAKLSTVFPWRFAKREPRRVAQSGNTSGHASNGFTVIELVVTLAVVGILASIAGPAVMNMIRDNSITSASNLLIASLNYARNQALLQHTTVKLCQLDTSTISNTVQKCATSNSSKGYASGWLIFTDPTLSGQPSVATDILKLTTLDLKNKMTIMGTATSRTPDISLVVGFTPLGMLASATLGTNNTGATTPFLVLCDDRAWARGGQYARVISIRAQGRITSVLGNKQGANTSTASSCTPS